MGGELYLIYNAMTFENSYWFWIIFLCFQPFSLWRTLCLTPKTTDYSKGIGWKTRHNQQEFSQTDGSGKVLKMLFKPHLIFLAIWVIAGDLRYTTYINGLQSWLSWASDGNQDVIDKFSNLYTIFYFSEFPIYLTVGFLLDYGSRKLTQIKFKNNRYLSLNTAQIITALIFQVFSQVMAMLISIILSFKSIGAQTYLLFLVGSLQICTLYVIRNTFLLVVVDKLFVGRIIGFINCYGLISAFTLPALTDFRNVHYLGNFHDTQLSFLVINFVGLFMPFLNYFWIFYWDKSDSILGENRGFLVRLEDSQTLET